jgi:hydrogenase expression/formation protein HypC
MCLAIPGRILEVRQDAHGVRLARADFGGIVKEICLEYTPAAAEGDHVLVHVGFALQVIDETEARRTYEALRELGELDESTEGGGEALPP